MQLAATRGILILLSVSALLALQRPPVIGSGLPATTAQNANEPGSKQAPPAQPIPYSHKTHLALGLKCSQCHPNPEPGDRMMLPSTSTCMTCHTTIAKDKAPIQKLTEYATTGTAIPWVRIYVLPGWVYWNHRSHLEAGMTCEMCHGLVKEKDIMTKETNATTMAGCVDCHRKHDASTGCRYCHGDR